jgi:hypothetical protein
MNARTTRLQDSVVTAAVVLSLIGGWLYGSHTKHTYAAPRWQMTTVVPHVGQRIPCLYVPPWTGHGGSSFVQVAQTRQDGSARGMSAGCDVYCRPCRRRSRIESATSLALRNTRPVRPSSEGSGSCRFIAPS